MAEEDICAKEIESRSSYEYALRKEDGEYFHNMLDECYKYSKAIDKKDKLIPTESMIMVLLFIQLKMIKNLLTIIESRRMNEKGNCLKNVMTENIEVKSKVLPYFVVILN
jgi:hypothetical protein